MAFPGGPADIGPDHDGAGFGGPGLGGLGGLGGPGFGGFGKSLNLDIVGGGGFPGFGGGFPGFGGGFPGFGAPYVPVTPLGGLLSFNGDLVVPIVAIGVAIFIFIMIVLAVKYALAWKLEVLDDLTGSKGLKFRRAVGDAPAEHLTDHNLNQLADIVAAAIYSEGCSRRILCEMGSFARQAKQTTSLLKLMELVVPKDYQGSFQIVTDAAEGNFECALKYPCGDVNYQRKQAQLNKLNPKDNEIDDSVTPLQPASSSSNQTSANQGSPNQANNATGFNATATTPAPAAQNIFGKFKRSFM